MKCHYTKGRWNSLSTDVYSSVEWRCLKIFFGAVFFINVFGALNEFNSIPYPHGIFRLISDIHTVSLPLKISLTLSLVTLLVLYLSEISMAIVTALLFFCSVFIYSIGESNGVMGRNGLMSLVFFAQSMAYILDHYKNGSRLATNRVQFSLQAVAAVYTLAAISKINASGIHWLTDAPYLSLQILKSFSFEYVTTGDTTYLNQGIAKASWVLQHPFITRFLLGSSLVLESLSLIMITGKKRALIYGILLLSMHLGIKWAMNISFESISLPMVTFCLNPLYLVYLTTQKLKTHFSQ